VYTDVEASYVSDSIPRFYYCCSFCVQQFMQSAVSNVKLVIFHVSLLFCIFRNSFCGYMIHAYDDISVNILVIRLQWRLSRHLKLPYDGYRPL